jgi:hypothetical protein
MMYKLALLISVLLLASPARANEGGQFVILTQNDSIVSGIRTDAENVWLKFTPDYRSEIVTVRISDQNRAAYRFWFNGEQDLVSGGERSMEIWTDRVQTKANYIEYWVGDELVLQLQRESTTSD